MAPTDPHDPRRAESTAEFAAALDLRAVAGRAAARALAAEAARGKASIDAPGTPGYEAAIEPSHTDAGRRDRAVVGAAALARVAEGGRFIVEPGARITPAAEEEAFRRGIRFVAGTAAQLSPPGSLRIALASDHGGFGLKVELALLLAELGHRVLDLGPATAAPCDYPEFASAVATQVSTGRSDIGVMLDGAGSGSAMAANKVPGVRAANCWDERSARNAREHNHANVLTLGAAHLDLAAARKVVVAFLSTPFGGERHARRVDLIQRIEARFSRVPERVDTFDPAR